MLVVRKLAFDPLNKAQVVAIPAETVYGLAHKYNLETAIKKFFELKNRALGHPLIIHIGDIKWLNCLTKSTPSYVNKLITTSWLGHLTVILLKSKKVSPLMTAGHSTVTLNVRKK